MYIICRFYYIISYYIYIISYHPLSLKLRRPRRGGGVGAAVPDLRHDTAGAFFRAEPTKSWWLMVVNGG
jgi:hypothetical protein